MNRFALHEPTLVTIEHVNLRDEKHGDDTVAAIDVKLSMETSAEVLGLFHPALRQALYCKDPHAPVAQQPPLELEPAAELPNLRWPHLEPLRWSEDLEHRTLTIDYGIGGKSSLKLTDCKANGFRIEPMEGGTVRLTWRIQHAQPDERVVGKLSGLLKRQVNVTLMASPETEALLAGSHDDSNVVDATDAFVAQHGSSLRQTTDPVA